MLQYTSERLSDDEPVSMYSIIMVRT